MKLLSVLLATGAVLASTTVVAISACSRESLTTTGDSTKPVVDNPSPPVGGPTDGPTVPAVAAIFSDSFDEQASWQPRPGSDLPPGGASAYCGPETTHCAWGIPTGWTHFRATGLWWGPTYHDTLRITPQEGRGGSGKALIMYHESNIGASGDGWGADAQLTKLLDKDYPELYARVWIKTQAGFKWSATNDMMLKLFRAYHFDRTGNMYSFFSGGSSGPIFIWDFKHSNTWGTRGANAFRGDPQESRYYMDGDSGADYLLKAGDSAIEPTGAGMLADGGWHSLEFQVRMNTYDAAISAWRTDGVCRVWIDGQLKFSRTNLLWKSAGSSPEIGWNTIGLAGNAYNTYSDAANRAEQWFAMDDLVISAHYSGPPPPPTAVTVQKLSSSSVRVSWAPATNEATYLLTGYRVSYGTDPANPSHTVEAGSSTTIALSGLTSGQTYYFHVSAYAKASYDRNENASLGATPASIVLNSESAPARG